MDGCDSPRDDNELDWLKRTIKDDPAILVILTSILISTCMRTFRMVGTDMGRCCTTQQVKHMTFGSLCE